MAEQHEELAWIPMCTTDAGTWFWHQGIRDRQRDAREYFSVHCCMEWSALRKDGWRIVRVRLSAYLQ